MRGVGTTTHQGPGEQAGQAQQECFNQSLKQSEGEEKCKPGASGPDLGVSSGPGAHFLRSEVCIIGCYSEQARFHWLGHFGIQKYLESLQSTHLSTTASLSPTSCCNWTFAETWAPTAHLLHLRLGSRKPQAAQGVTFQRTLPFDYSIHSNLRPSYLQASLSFAEDA